MLAVQGKDPDAGTDELPDLLPIVLGVSQNKIVECRLVAVVPESERRAQTDGITAALAAGFLTVLRTDMTRRA